MCAVIGLERDRLRLEEQEFAESLIRENEDLKARLQEVKAEKRHWKDQALANEQRLLNEQLARDRAEQAGKQAEFVARLSTFISGVFDYTENLQNLLRLIVSEFADWASVDLLSEESVLARVAVASRNPQQEEYLRDSYKHYPLNLQGPHPIAQVLRDGKPRLEKTSGPYQAVNQPGPAAPEKDNFNSTGDQSYILVPLQAGGEILGVFVFVRLHQRPPFETADLAIAEDLAAKVALMIQNSNLYAKLQKALENQQELNYYKDLYLSMLSHELRNPLASIRGYSQIIGRSLKSRQTETNPGNSASNANLETPPPPADYDKEFRALNILLNQSDRMNRMVSELLDFSRIQKNTFELNYPTTVDLVELIERVVEQQSLVSRTHPIEIKTNHPHLKGIVDENRMEQVFNNLISNAIKYSPPESLIIIGIELQPANRELEDAVDHALISIQDFGQGIDKEAQEHLFERYYRVRTEKNRLVQGLGLGLFICKEIVTRHGGKLWVESQPDQGSTFFVQLPLKPLPRPT